MLQLDASNLPALARGCAVLGAGGGGDTGLGLVMAVEAVRRYGPVTVLELDDLDDEAHVMPCGMVGSPSIARERIWSGDEGDVLRLLFEDLHGGPVDALMCFEIGGANGLLPVTWAARCGLPLLDADGMGRAFPELRQQAMHVADLGLSPLALTDGRGSTLVLRAADDAAAARLAREVATSLGGACGAALCGMRGVQARHAVIAGSVSMALRLGSALGGVSIGGALDALRRVIAATVLIEGRVVDLERDAGGTPIGAATVRAAGGPAAMRQLRLELQNEYLLAFEDGALRAAVPDLICLLATDGGLPIATEDLRYGQSVAVVAAPAAAVWHGAAGLAVAGPRAFGYDLDHAPIAAAVPING
ncbi:MAG TPA: DUF917 domain-containing protein [Solirubrobacteraceae bacterium]|jgi:DUF917 family protein|nr:DUF917 domain-containing protein [Solirubrobacteraceae bacterium]